MPRRLLVPAALVLLSALGCSRSEASPAAPEPAAAHGPAAGSRPTLVFFMNPNGRPCQMQDEILRSMPDLAARAEVVRFKTTEPGDIPRFEQFGIRALPQLLVVDASGAVLRRPTPGILSDPQVRQLLSP